MKILTPNIFYTIAQYVIRETDGQEPLTHDPFTVLVSKTGTSSEGKLGGWDVLEFNGPKGSRAKISIAAGELSFDATDRDALEYYFASLLAHISQQQ